MEIATWLFKWLHCAVLEIWRPRWHAVDSGYRHQDEADQQGHIRSYMQHDSWLKQLSTALPGLRHPREHTSADTMKLDTVQSYFPGKMTSASPEL